MPELKNPLVKRVVNRFAEAIQPRQIILFGSQAQGESQEDSALDLVIIYDGPISKRDLKHRVHNLFPHLDFSMDLFVLSAEEPQRQRNVANSLARDVSERGVLVYGS